MGLVVTGPLVQRILVDFDNQEGASVTVTLAGPICGELTRTKSLAPRQSLADFFTREIFSGAFVDWPAEATACRTKV